MNDHIIFYYLLFDIIAGYKTSSYLPVVSPDDGWIRQPMTNSTPSMSQAMLTQ